MSQAVIRRLSTAAALAGLLVLGACATTPEARLAGSLTSVGVPGPAASCFARDVTPRLSASEVDQLVRAIGAIRSGGRSMTLAQAAQVAREAGDAHTLGVIVRAAALCV
jgi:hypothetical protein